MKSLRFAFHMGIHAFVCTCKCFKLQALGFSQISFYLYFPFWGIYHQCHSNNCRKDGSCLLSLCNIMIGNFLFICILCGGPIFWNNLHKIVRKVPTLSFFRKDKTEIFRGHFYKGITTIIWWNSSGGCLY